MRDLDLTTLRLFVTVCDTRNIARAGELHNIVASAISKRLLLLEESVGNKLIERHRRGVVPTSAGEILLEHARAMLAGADRAARHGGPRQRRQGAGAGAGDGVVDRRIPARRHRGLSAGARAPRHPHRHGRSTQPRPGARHSGRRRAAGRVLGRRRPRRAADAALPQRPPGDHRAPSHPIARLGRCAFAQTLDFEHVGLPASTAVHTMLARAAAIIGKPVSYRAVVSTFDASMRCVRANLGIAVVPREVAEPIVGSLGIAVVPLSDAWARRRFALCFQAEKKLSPAARLLVTHLEGRAEGRKLPA